jgi:hypothetical protein
MVKDLIFCLQEVTLYLVFQKHRIPKYPSECFVNPPCGCANPGQNIQCEDCTYLESCLSNCKQQNIPFS